MVAFANCIGEEFPADCFGAIGFGMPGVDCCPTELTPWACCLPDGSCILTADDDDCSAQGGAWFPSMLCDAANCSAPRACCVEGTCHFVTPAECVALGGWPLPESVDCEPDPCGSVPAAPTTWGALKAAYR